MKVSYKYFLCFHLLAFLMFVIPEISYAKGSRYHSHHTASTYKQNYVKGYYRGNGTYVKGHYRSHPDHNSFNNWSTIGNYNPHTSEPGKNKPYRTKNTKRHKQN